MSNFEFELISTDPAGPRRGEFKTPHGTVQTPIFMPVGTAAAMKAVTPAQMKELDCQILLSNAYHLEHQPGSETIKRFGGLHDFMGWDGPILTDSGGFQVFSLRDRVIDDDGVTFSYQKGGKSFRLTPEKSMEIQSNLGADIIMAFDECVEHPCTYSYAKEALDRTAKWAAICKKTHKNPNQALFGISQGAIFEDLRKESFKQLIDIDFPGYAIGGLSVGEGLENMKTALDFTTPLMPQDKPRYLMGIGLPEDILEAVERGIDMMDCVIPTKFARSGMLFTNVGKVRVTNAEFRKDKFPVDTNCGCYTCQNFSRGYLHHLFAANEILGATLTSIHNVSFYLTLMDRIRDAIEERRFASFKADFLKLYNRKTAKKTGRN
ncbi:MAG: tRNA guanosine(34) transglycosylase Tgt [SAR324 cluster bacterium]|nr:tRNA guanosine(34) transglycosylase Tgt [SAR324 cluster bacterium]